jgi:tetratricopeptide (TPR) repeat protein
MTRLRPSPLLARFVACSLLAFCAARTLCGETPSPEAGKASEATSPVAAANAPSSSVKPARASDEIHGLLNLGLSLTDRGDYDAAEIAYRQVLNASGVAQADTKTALLGLARMHRRQGAFTKAAAIYERYLLDYAGDERTPDALLELGRTLRDMGVYKLAIARFYSVINSTLKLPSGGMEHYQALAKTAKFEIAETHFQAGDYAEASRFYTRLRLEDLAPADRARAHFKAAYSMRLQGDLDGAVATLRSYIAQWPDDENVPEARYLLSISLRELKRPQEAFAATLDLLRTEKARVATDPKRWAYWQRRTGNQLANDFFESGDILNAQAIYSSLLELSGEPSWQLPITYQLALCYDRLGITDRARLSYQAVVDGAAKAPSPEFAELARMAAWRIEHLDWREKTSQQLAKFFDTTTGKQVALPPPANNAAATP